MVCGSYKNGGGYCAQEYSPWPFLIIGGILVVVGVLLFIRMRLGSAISSRTKGLLVLILVVSVLIFGLIAAPSTRPPMRTEFGRVQNAFNEMSLMVVKKEGVPPSWMTPIHTDVISYPDGLKVSLWVPNPAPSGIRSNCFYVDEQAKSHASGFTSFACDKPKSTVTLERQNSVVVGFISETRANFATIASGGITVEAPITFRYFIFPSVVSEDPKAKFAISFIDPGGATCKIVDLPAPGSSASIECVIA